MSSNKKRISLIIGIALTAFLLPTVALAGYEDFTTYTEVDAGNNITVATNKISWTALDRNEESYVYADKGVDHFDGDFSHKFEIYRENASGYPVIYYWGIANAVDDLLGIDNAGGDFQAFLFEASEGGGGTITLRICENGSTTSDSWTAALDTTVYYVTVERDDDGGANGTGQLTAEIRTGSHTGTLQDTLTVDCGSGEQNDFRYIYGVSAHNSGHSDRCSDGYTANLDLQENTAPTVSFNATPSQSSDGDGKVTIDVEVDDADNDDTCKLKVEYSLDNSTWEDPTIESGTISADFGTPALDNDAEYQIGTSSAWIETSSGSNSVSFVWLSGTDEAATSDTSVYIKVTAHDGTEDCSSPPTSSAFGVDNVAPTISSVTAPTAATYVASEDINFVVNTDENVTVSGSPRIELTIGAATQYATYASGSGTQALTFTYTVQADDTDSDGIASSSPIDLNSGTMKDASGNNLTLTFTSPDTSGVLVDATNPTLSSITWDDVDSSNTISEDDTLTFVFSEAMDTSTITLANVDTVLPPSSGNYGSSGAKSISWTNNTTLVVTLGGSPTIARGATINPTTAVTDAAGNADNTSGNGPAFVDPYGVVFDSVTNNPVQGATVTIYTSGGTQCTPGDQIAATDTNPQTTSSTGEYSFLCANGTYYITVSASGYTYPSTKSSFPSGRTITTGSKQEDFTVSGSVLEIDLPLDPGSSLLTITKDANKKEVEVGDIVTYTVTIENSTSSDITNVYLEDTIPGGFKYLEGKATLDGQTTSNPQGNRPLTFDIGTVSANTTTTLKYQLIVGSGVTLGNYQNTCYAKYSDGTIISNQTSETVQVTPSTLFELGSIIGKVFYDYNQNRTQDPNEPGLPNIQLVTEDGTIITTDKHGKYHLPALTSGRHLLRLDEHTLPEGSYLTTDKVVIVDITPGLIAKVNFGVNIDGKQLPSNVQGPMSNVEKDKTYDIGPTTYDRSHLFFLAMGDLKTGYTFHTGYIQPIQHDDQFREGFWYEGRLAYYLKGKIKGKYLITSSLDTQRQTKELFKHIDPDKFYPVYGDASKIDYQAQATQGALYLLIEWDKSSALWGNYLTNLTDTELASFNRTLYGGKLSYQSVSQTRFGEPKTKLILFRSQAKQKASHNEFLATGGSLYYLKHKDITEGSEKVTLEVRDKITHLALSTKTMSSSQDYEIDYEQGRLTFYQPISQTIDSSSIISSTLTLGHPLYIVVDYEYQTKDKYDQGISGLRAQKAISDYLTVGTTYINEDQEGSNYTLKAYDTKLNLGKQITLTGEYAESESEQLDYYISIDGGLSFTQLNTTDDHDQGEAFSLKGQAQLLNDKLNLTSYYKRIERGFSQSSTISQQGKRLTGASLKLDLSPQTKLTARHDIQKLLSDGNPQTQLQVGATQTKTTQAQITHTQDKLKLTGEYHHQELNDKLTQYQSETNTETDTLALKADYQLKDNIKLSLTQQANLTGPTEHKTTAGISSQLNPNLTLRAKQTLSTEGNATSLGATFTPAKQHPLKARSWKLEEKEETSILQASTSSLQPLASNRSNFSPSAIALSADLTHQNHKAEGSSDTLSLTAQGSLDDETLFHTTYALTDGQGEGKTESITFGSTKKLTPEYSLTTDKTYAKTKDKLTQAHSFSLRKETIDNQTLEASLTEQHSQDKQELSSSNIFSLSGDLNNNFKIQGSFEKGTVQKHNGNLYNRHATSLVMGYAKEDPKTKETTLTASSKLEFRFDEGAEEINHLLISGTLEEHPNPNTHLFAQANISQTKDTTNSYMQAKYKELVLGAAYRPLFLDKLNLLAKYTYLEDDSPSTQTDISDIEAEKSHTISTELIYDLTPHYQLVEKLAFKEAKEDTLGFDFTKTQTYLNITRLNYSPHSNWQLALEYRRLTQEQAEDTKQGALVELSRNLGQFIQVGCGYNFTDFSDDLTHLDYTSHGPFIRLTGKLYDRTPEEIAQAKQKAQQTKLEHLLKERISLRFKQQTPETEAILASYQEASRLYTQGELKAAQTKFNQTLTLIDNLEHKERLKLEQLLKQEDEINSLFEEANSLYREGQLKQALKYYQQCLEEIETLRKKED